MTVKDYHSKLYCTVQAIIEFEKATGFVYDNTASELEIDKSNPSEVFELIEANKLLRQLENCAIKASYLLSEVQHEGKIAKTSYDQYELDGVTLECGTALEVLLWNNQEERYQYTYTTIEHNGEGYYLTCNGSKELEGLKARLRFSL